MAKKTDNHNPRAKLDLRRYFLRKYHADGEIRVFDCCQGSGLLWRKLREEFPVASYWGVDLKPKAGRLKIDSQRILVQPGMKENVIDIDTYGLPWKHWAALLPGLNRPVTVFLTIGSITAGLGSKPSTEEIKMLGLSAIAGKLPMAFTVKVIRKISTSYLLTICYDYGIIIKEAVEAVSDGHATYIGVRLEMKAAEPELKAPAQPKQAKLKRSKAHV